MADCSTSLATKDRHGLGNGSNFIALNPRATVSTAFSAYSSGRDEPAYQPLAYTRMRPRHGPPSRR